MMSALGVLTLINYARTATIDLSIAFLAVYMMLFAILLFSYELMWWVPIPWLNKMLRKNFGFMYGLQGKGLYLIFVAFLCLGLGGDNAVKALTWATGIAYLAFGFLHVFITCVHSSLALKYQAPTAGLLAKEYASNSTPNPV
jgi:COPI associated protein